MTEDEIITLGLYAEGLLQEENFRVLAHQYALQCFDHFMSTDPKALKERESIYNQMRALEDFKAHLAAVVFQKTEIIKQQQLALSPEDAPIDGID